MGLAPRVMTFTRFCERQGLTGRHFAKSVDLKRLIEDATASREDYARRAGCTPDQAAMVLTLFFRGFPEAE
jgi:hypothetical protein